MSKSSLITREALQEGQPQNPNLTDFLPDFDFEKYNIEIEDLEAEVQKYTRDGYKGLVEDENCFPAEVFPEPFKGLIHDCKIGLNFPSDYTGAAILSAVSTAIGKGVKVRVKEGWYEFAASFIALLGNAGANKSHPLDLAYKPHFEIDRERFQRFKAKMEIYQASQTSIKKSNSQGEQPGEPVLIKTVMSDFTPEVLHKRLAANDRGCVIVSEELATFLEGMNRYSRGDQTSMYLSMWSNKSTSIDRIKDPRPLYLPQPFLNIIGTLQPRVLSKLFPSGKTDNGFLQRFLFAYPDDAEKKAINDNEIDRTVTDKYKEWIVNYIDSNTISIDGLTGLAKSRVYEWSEPAKRFFYNWQRENTLLVNEHADSLYGEILSKFDIHFIRLAIVLQIMINYNVNEISLSAVEGSAKLCAYFKIAANKVLNILQSAGPADVLPINKRNLYNLLPDDFTTAQAQEIGKNVDNGKGRGFDEKAIDRFIGNTALFTKQSHGRYKKRHNRV